MMDTTKTEMVALVMQQETKEVGVQLRATTAILLLSQQQQTSQHNNKHTTLHVQQ